MGKFNSSVALNICIIFAILTSACVSNKQVQYLQHNDVNVDAVVVDSVMRIKEYVTTEYKIRPHDILSIQFKSLTNNEYAFLEEPVAAGNQMVSDNNAGALLAGELVNELGMVNIPVIGNVKISNLTILQAQEKLQQLANSYFENIIVKVKMLNFRFTILGEVQQEGTIASYNSKVSILEGIGLAGGISDLANRSQIKIVRDTEGVIEVGYVNLLDENMVTSPFYYLRSNDVIIVPPLKQRPFRKYANQNFSIILSSISTLLLITNLLINNK